MGLRAHAARGAGGVPQRGHQGKSSGGILRVQADPNKMSAIAAGAVVGYGGHLPGAQCGFGMSAYRVGEEELSA